MKYIEIMRVIKFAFPFCNNDNENNDNNDDNNDNNDPNSNNNYEICRYSNW